VLEVPREVELTEPGRPSSFSLLRRRDFATLFAAVSISELGDALNYIALMWLALRSGGPLGVVAVRLADSVPGIVFGLPGGGAAAPRGRPEALGGAALRRGRGGLPPGACPRCRAPSL